MTILQRAVRRGGAIFLEDGPPESLKPDCVRLRVEACGICGTDIHLASADGLVTGHEVAGTILERGEHVDGVALGAAVAVDSATPCGRCSACHNGRQELCTDIRSFWGSFGYCREMVVPAISCLDSTGLDPVVACLQESLGVAIDMVRLAAIEPGQNVLLMGAGPIGLMAIPLLRRAGANRVFATGFRRRRARMEAALAFGADAFLDPGETPLREYRFGCPLDRVLVTTPPPTLADAFGVAAKGGIVVFIGIAPGAGGACTFDANVFHFKKLQLRASYGSPALFGPMALGLLRDRVVDGQRLVTHTFPLARVAEAFDVAARDPSAIKVVVKP
jgi:L-iditol 2-dehydrogenase